MFRASLFHTRYLSIRMSSQFLSLMWICTEKAKRVFVSLIIRVDLETQKNKGIQCYFFGLLVTSSLTAEFSPYSFQNTDSLKIPSKTPSRLVSGKYFFLMLYSRNSLSSEHQKQEFRESLEHHFCLSLLFVSSMC